MLFVFPFSCTIFPPNSQVVENDIASFTSGLYFAGYFEHFQFGHLSPRAFGLFKVAFENDDTRIEKNYVEYFLFVCLFGGGVGLYFKQC